MDTDDDATRLRVLWNKGRNMYASFFVELGAVRKRIGDDKLSDWCFNELHISLSVISDTASLLKKADAKRERDDLARAREHEREKKRTAKDARTAVGTKAEIERLQAEVDRLNGLLSQQAKERRVTPSEEKRYTCEHCGQPMDALRSTARYCSTRCRVAAYRQRQ
jgi:hypothetical protein